ncbi:hypothetical protein HanXRQr2_Chr07g0279541 [Helianthus annuus]|uniref:Uncharacterized protein n=1 Tax=Helianthus annuus TaxID=4232 RepID=A0A251UC24_HELAN|nr:hypothetical protein HanXRQr2_Chr07g0279541 [Helianthus annuus]
MSRTHPCAPKPHHPHLSTGVDFSEKVRIQGKLSIWGVSVCVPFELNPVKFSALKKPQFGASF